MLLPKFLSRKISPEKSLDFVSKIGPATGVILEVKTTHSTGRGKVYRWCAVKRKDLVYIQAKNEILDISPGQKCVTPVAGPIFETKNRAIFLERFFGRGITAREQLCRAVILARF